MDDRGWFERGEAEILIHLRNTQHTICTEAAIAASASAFSLAAPLYDAEQANNRIARWSRARSLDILDRVFGIGDRVLELGCGTGGEALHLAKRGVTVIATDAAPGMLSVLEGKLARIDKRVGQHITVVQMPAGRAEELVPLYGKYSLDGVYSSFGPLNCEPELGAVAEALSDLVRPGGRVVLSFINRYCVWETLWYLLARQPRKAFRRWPGSAQATVYAGWQERRISVYYWSPGEIERAFCPNFRVVRRMALPWLLPPQYLDGILRGRTHLFRLLARVETISAETWPMYALGDHLLLEFVRRPITR